MKCMEKVWTLKYLGPFSSYFKHFDILEYEKSTIHSKQFIDS
jgi:hypothetical protein